MPRSALEATLDIYEVKITSGATKVRLFDVEGYSVQDVGKQINRVQFANNAVVYYQELPYNAGYKTISFNGSCWKADFDELEVIYRKTNAERIISFTDLYGKSFSYGFISNLVWNKVATNAVDACTFTIELVVVENTNYIFRVGGTAITYGIESCSLKEIKAEPEFITDTSGNRKILVHRYLNSIYEIDISGIELIDPSTKKGEFTGDLTTDVFTFTPPSLFTLKALVRNVETSLIAGKAGFQNFSVSLFATTSEFDFLDDNCTIIESWTLRDDSARTSVHKTVGGVVAQVFDPVPLMTLNMVVLTHNDGQYENGTEWDDINCGYTNSSGSVVTFRKGVITEKTINYVEGNTKLKRVTLVVVLLPPLTS